MNYTVADFIIRIKNAALAKRREVVMPYSRMANSLARILLKERYLEDVKEETRDNKKILTLRIGYEKRSPVLTNVLLVSKPSLRVYIRPSEIAGRERKSLHTFVISTHKGIMTGKEAFQKVVGGELLFEIW